MADAYLETGSHQAALSVCQAAEQILPGPAVERARWPSPRGCVCSRPSAREQAAAQAWTAVRATLKELVTVAPRITISGVPTLEKVSQFIAETTEKIRAVPADTPAVEAARVYLAALRRWSDCEEAFQKLRQIAARLESERDPRRALQVVGKLLELRPADPDLKAAASRLEALARDGRGARGASERRLSGNTCPPSASHGCTPPSGRSTRSKRRPTPALHPPAPTTSAAGSPRSSASSARYARRRPASRFGASRSSPAISTF